MAGKQPKRKARPGVDKMGRSPLHYAALEGDLGQMHKLLSAGAEPALADDNGWTPLRFAAQEQHLDVGKVLIAAGATVDAADTHGNTPLIRAVFSSHGSGAFIKLLRDAGADPNLKNRHGVSPVQLARSIGNYDVAQFFNDMPQ